MQILLGILFDRGGARRLKYGILDSRPWHTEPLGHVRSNCQAATRPGEGRQGFSEARIEVLRNFLTRRSKVQEILVGFAVFSFC